MKDLVIDLAIGSLPGLGLIVGGVLGYLLAHVMGLV